MPQTHSDSGYSSENEVEGTDEDEIEKNDRWTSSGLEKKLSCVDQFFFPHSFMHNKDDHRLWGSYIVIILLGRHNVNVAMTLQTCEPGHYSVTVHHI